MIKCHFCHRNDIANLEGSRLRIRRFQVLFLAGYCFFSPLIIKCFPCSAHLNSIQKYTVHFFYNIIEMKMNTSHVLKILVLINSELYRWQAFLRPAPPPDPAAEYTRHCKSSSLARNDAVIGISTNNTRIHHSHGNITQTSRVRVWRVYSETKKFNLNHNIWLFLITLHAQRTLLFSGCKASFHANHHVSPKSKSFVLLHHELAREPGYLVLSILLTA